jgi:hypothetical protein
MKKPKIMKDAVRLIKGEPLNTDERMELLEKKLDFKISQFEDSMTTFHETIKNLHKENVSLKEENSELKKSYSERIGSGSVSILGGIKEKLITPLVNNSKEFAEFVLNDEDEKPMKTETPGPKFASKQPDKKTIQAESKVVYTKNETESTKNRSAIKLLKDKLAKKNSAVDENYVKVEFVGTETTEQLAKDPLAQPELAAETDIEKNAVDLRNKTAKWMRQKFGLSPEIQERKFKSKSRRFKKK